MIEVNKESVKLEGDISTLLAETTAVVTQVCDLLATKTPLEKHEVLDKIIEGVRFYNLLNAGMTADEATKIMRG